MGHLCRRQLPLSAKGGTDTTHIAVFWLVKKQKANYGKGKREEEEERRRKERRKGWLFQMSSIIKGIECRNTILQ